MISMRSEPVIDLYRYVVKAGHPVSVEEILKKGVPNAYRSHAYQVWTTQVEELTGATIVDEHWKVPENREVAWQSWVKDLIRAMVASKILTPETPPEKKLQRNLPDSERLYGAGRPPQVKYPNGKVRNWTPEFDLVHEKAVAGMRVTQRAETVIASLAALPDKRARDAAIALVKDAVLAIKP